MMTHPDILALVQLTQIACLKLTHALYADGRGIEAGGEDPTATWASALDAIVEAGEMAARLRQPSISANIDREGLS